MKGCDRLTDTAIKAALRRAVQQDLPKLFDGKGMYIQFTRDSALNGKGYWRLKYRIAGKEKLISLGIYPETSLMAARRSRDKARELLQGDTDPSVHRQDEKTSARDRSANTFKLVAKEWYEKKSRAWAKNNSAIILRRLEKDVFPFVGDDAIAEISSKDMLDVLRRVEDRGAIESAHRIRQYIDAIFRFAVNTQRATANPTPDPEVLASPKKGKFASITDPKGVGALIRSIRGYQGSLVVQTALRFAPLVFVRPGELRCAEWSEMDLDVAEWRIPDKRMKMKAPHMVPLSHQAVALLKALRPLTGRGRYVFPSERSSQRPMSSNTLNAALRALGFSKDQMTAHGFRHMASSLLNESGKWNRDAIERQLAHTDQDSIRAAYNFSELLEERRRMMQWWSNKLDMLSASNNVVQLATRA
jgi:integrase